MSFRRDKPNWSVMCGCPNQLGQLSGLHRKEFLWEINLTLNKWAKMDKSHQKSKDIVPWRLFLSLCEVLAWFEPRSTFKHASEKLLKVHTLFGLCLISDVFERHTSTGSDLFSLLISLDATKFVLLSVLTLKETICPRICKKHTTEECKTSTSGWRASLKNVVA